MPKYPFEVINEVILGESYDIDPGVILGYMTGRSIEDRSLQIGAGARIRSGTVIYGGSKIGEGLETGHGVVIREENLIGNHLSIWNNSTIDYGCVIGSRVRVHTNVYVAQFTTIEDGVFIGPGVQIANDPHPVCGLCMKGPTIKKNARIGVNVTILSHLTIGEGALIGAGSVVTKDIAPHMLAYGNPAREMKSVEELPCPFDLVDKPYMDGLDVDGQKREGMI